MKWWTVTIIHISCQLSPSSLVITECASKSGFITIALKPAWLCIGSDGIKALLPHNTPAFSLCWMYMSQFKVSLLSTLATVNSMLILDVDFSQLDIKIIVAHVIDHIVTLKRT